MNPTYDRQLNQAAYRRLRTTIDQTYPKGRYVAIHQGHIIADAASSDELRRHLVTEGLDPTQILFVQAGVDYPEFAFILFA